MDPALFDPHFPPRLPEAGTDGVLTPPYVWQPRPKFQGRVWLHVTLFALTVGTTWLVQGWAYSVTILSILGCHELGHYFACRYYDVDASLPYFLPVPIPPTGTLGAFIRIREPIRTKRMLFDIGFAGPIAGFLVAVPALFLGVAWSKVAPIEQGGGLVALKVLRRESIDAPGLVALRARTPLPTLQSDPPQRATDALHRRWQRRICRDHSQAVTSGADYRRRSHA